MPFTRLSKIFRFEFLFVILIRIYLLRGEWNICPQFKYPPSIWVKWAKLFSVCLQFKVAPRLEIFTFGLLLYQTNQHEQIWNTSSQFSLKTSPIKDQSRAVEPCEDCEGPSFPGHQYEEGVWRSARRNLLKGSYHIKISITQTSYFG